MVDLGDDGEIADLRALGHYGLGRVDNGARLQTMTLTNMEFPTSESILKTVDLLKPLDRKLRATLITRSMLRAYRGFVPTGPQNSAVFLLETRFFLTVGCYSVGEDISSVHLRPWPRDRAMYSVSAAGHNTYAYLFDIVEPSHTKVSLETVLVSHTNCASKMSQFDEDDVRFCHEIARDQKDLESGHSGIDVFQKPLWIDTREAEASAQDWLYQWDTYWSNEPSKWSFWREWYQGILDGKPLDWALQRRVALIDEAIWEAGPEAAAKEIEQVRAKFDLEKRIGELEADLRRTTVNRHGIGGNMPPEVIDDAPIALELIIVWKPLEELKEEIAKNDPDRKRLQSIIEALVTALNTGFAWSLKKGDLIVDTGIKWAIPAGGTGYFVLNPEKLEAVIEAANKLLSVH